MVHGILTTQQQWRSGHVQRLRFLPTPWHRSPIAVAITNLPTAKTQARTPPNTATQNTCTCDASSLGTAEARAVRRLDACDVSRCSTPSLAISSSSSSTSRPNIPARPGHGGPQPGGSPCNNGKMRSRRVLDLNREKYRDLKNEGRQRHMSVQFHP